MRKIADFATYKKVRNLSFNDFNRWVTSLYNSGYNDGVDDAMRDCMASITDEELMDTILSVKGIGQKRASELMEKICKR